MTILLADPRVAAIPVRESYEPLVTLGAAFGPARARVRSGLAARLRRAQLALPAGMSLRVVEGHRSAEAQASLIELYAGQVRAAHPGLDAAECNRLTSHYVAPPGVAGHVAGAAVDLTVADVYGRELDLGTPIGVTPEESGGRGAFAAPTICAAARAHRVVLAGALTAVGLVNYPAEWWHWSFGDRYWAVLAGASVARYGPVDDLDGPRVQRPRDAA